MPVSLEGVTICDYMVMVLCAVCWINNSHRSETLSISEISLLQWTADNINLVTAGDWMEWPAGTTTSCLLAYLFHELKNSSKDGIKKLFPLLIKIKKKNKKLFPLLQYLAVLCTISQAQKISTDLMNFFNRTR